MDDKEKFTELYNKTGIPFQFWCLSTLRKIKNYDGIPEVPFTHPPSFGPQLGKQSTADIWASRIPNPHNRYPWATLFCIECKKADPLIKKWFFSADYPEEEKMLSTFLLKSIDKDREYKHSILKEGVFPSLGYNSLEDLDGCIQSVEFNEKLTTINRNENEKIYKALLQANHALNSFFCKFNDIFPLIEGLDLYSNTTFEKILFIPIVVTTADLYIAKYDPKDVDHKNGKIEKEKIDFEGPKSWLTYEFPLPDYLKYTGEKDVEMTIKIPGMPSQPVKELMLQNERITTFVVNSGHWEEFLEKFDFFSDELRK